MQKKHFLPGIIRALQLLSPFSSAISTMPTAQDVLEQIAALTTGYVPDIESEASEASYYDYPVLKRPAWHWEIVWYFFFGGLAAGSYNLASIVSLFGSKEDRIVSRAGYYLSLLALLPCPPLLIKDLGRPERFLNMLRIFKPKSPMSMGTWCLLGFSLFSGLTAVIQAARDGLLGRWWGSRLLAALPQKLLSIPGTGLGFFLGGYTGVLLAATSVPLWSRSKLLGATFITSAISTSAALLSLVLRLVHAPISTLHKLERVEWLAMLTEVGLLLSFLRGSGRAARALVGTKPGEQGPLFWRFMFGGGLLLPLLLQSLSLVGIRIGKRNNAMGIAVSLLALMGGYFLRRTLIYGGHTSSRDAKTTLWNARR